MAFLVFYIGNMGYLGEKKVCIKKLNLTEGKKISCSAVFTNQTDYVKLM